VTTKSSIRDLGVLYKSGVYALKALYLTSGGLTCVPKELRVEQSTLIACEKSAVHGQWRLSRSQGLVFALTTQYFTKLGLPKLPD
jgi:hypothetical protein